MLRASLTADVKEQLADVAKEYNGLLLSMDGVQLEKGNETLYVVREGFSRRILEAKNQKSNLGRIPAIAFIVSTNKTEKLHPVSTQRLKTYAML